MSTPQYTNHLRATLLLAHAKTQVLNQKRLESYLSLQSQLQPNLDLSGRFERLQHRSLSRHRSPARRTPGADTPRDLNSRVKILELYTLHVLTRNDEWDYARDFIISSPILDEERREAFLLALQSLHDERYEAEKRESEERQRREEQQQQEVDESRRIRAENEDRERRRIEEQRARRESADNHGAYNGRGGEVEYSGDGTSSASRSRQNKAPPSNADSTSTRGGKRSRSSKASQSASATGSTIPAHTYGSANAKSSKAKGRVVATTPTLSSRTTMLFANISGMFEQLGLAFQTTPMALLRTLFFIAALLIILGRRASRERIQHILSRVWNKVKATAGMGVKVSYI